MAGRGRGRKPVSELIDWDAVAAQDEDCKSRGFKLREKLREGAFEDTKETMLDTMTGRELTLEYIQRSGFVKPILVQRRDDLGLKVPPRDLSVEGIMFLLLNIGPLRHNSTQAGLGPPHLGRGWKGLGRNIASGDRDVVAAGVLQHR